MHVFHDERIIDERIIGKQWLYHGFFVVPANAVSEVRETLHNLRKTGKEIRFSKLNASASTSTRTATALEWARYYKDTLYLIAHYYILGVDLNKIDIDKFGGPSDSRSEKERRLYNRFFEIGLYGGMRFFYPEDQHIVVEGIFADKRLLQENDPFRHLPIYKINRRESNIEVLSQDIILVSSDPEEEQEHSEMVDFIDFADVILGAHSHNLDASSQSKTGCDEVADVIMEITEKLTQRPFNKNSHYWKRYAMSFFPKIRIAESALWPNSPSINLFYHNRKIKRHYRRQMALPFLDAS